jgi:hypothetical protein
VSRWRFSGVSVALLVMLGTVVIDLAFSGNPALSIGILLVVTIITVAGLSRRGGLWPRGSAGQL